MDDSVDASFFSFEAANKYIRDESFYCCIRWAGDLKGCTIDR